jgi:hypothetical protein
MLFSEIGRENPKVLFVWTLFGLGIAYNVGEGF